MERRRTLRGALGGGRVCVDVSFTGDGSTLATLSGEGLVQTWATSTGEILSSLDAQVRRPDGSREVHRAGAIAWDGSKFVAASDAMARVWALPEGRVVSAVTCIPKWVRNAFCSFYDVIRVALSRDAAFVGTVDRLGFLKVWSVEDGERSLFVTCIKGEVPREEVVDVAFSNDNKLIACEYGKVCVYPSSDADYGRGLFPWNARVEALGTRWGRVCMAASDDASILVVADEEVHVQDTKQLPYPCWSVEAPHGRAAADDRIRQTRTTMSHVVLSRDNRTVVTVGSVDKRVCSWHIDTATESGVLATLGSATWRGFWRRDGDGALWSRVLAFSGRDEVTHHCHVRAESP